VPFLKCTDNGHELFVVDLIVAFSGAVFAGEKGDGVEDAMVVVLGQYSGRDEVRSVCFDDYFSVVVEVSEDWCCGKGGFKAVERVGAVRSPGEGDIFSSEAGQRGDDAAVTFNKTVVKIGKP
jgi:hypothetical protein